MYYIWNSEKNTIIPTKILKAHSAANVLGHPIRSVILEMLSKQNLYPMQIAEALKIHEQKVYYHMNILKKEGFIDAEDIKLPGAAKQYSLKKTAYSFIPKYIDPKHREMSIHDYTTPPEMLKPFVDKGKINCRIIVGSPMPHGKLNRTERCGHLAGDIAAMLGKYGSSEGKLTYLDTDVDNLKGNLIIISGFYVNTAEKEVNSALPIKLNESGTKIISTISGDEFTEPETGFIVKTKNPLDKKYDIIVLAGIEMNGTIAAVQAFTKYFSRIEKGNKLDRNIKAKVVQGIEKKGRIEDVMFLE